MTSIVNLNESDFDFRIDRGSIFGNPYVIGLDGSRMEVIEKYKRDFPAKLLDSEFRVAVLKLKNLRLGCHCFPRYRCHGEVIKEYLDSRRGLAIIGSRTFNNYAAANRVWEKYFKNNFDYIVSGGAVGADSLGKNIAEEYKLDMVEFLPDYDKYGKSAPLKRNEQIIKNSAAVLIFWDGKSRGSKHALDLAAEYKRPSFVFYF